VPDRRPRRGWGRHVARVVLVLVAIVPLGCGQPDSGADEPLTARAPRDVSLALDFTPNAVHAGVYTAQRGRLDRPRGVALRVRPPTNSSDSLRTLTSGRADLAIVDIHDLGLARERGQDVIGVGAIVQRPLAAIIARDPVRRPRDLEGRRVGVTGLPSDDAVLRSIVEADGGDPEKVRRVTIGFTAVPNLVAGKLDAAVAFWNAEGVALREAGVRARQFRVDDFGAPHYPELVLAATRETLETKRELIQGTVAALAAGTDAALRDPEPAIRQIARASEANAALIRAQFEAVRPTLSPPLRLDPTIIRQWAAFDKRFGILRRPDPRAGFDFSVAPAAARADRGR